MTAPTKAPRLLDARSPMILGFATLAVVAAVLVGWGMLTELDGAVIAPGRVEVEQNRQVIQHPDGGQVAEVAVTEAQAVQAGDLLVRLDGTLMRSELAIAEAQLFELMAHRARLEAERDGAAAPAFPPELTDLAATRPEVAQLLAGQQALFAARAETLGKQTQQLQRRQEQIASQIAGIDAQEAAYDSQLKLIERELADQQSLLDKGLAQASRVLALEREQAGLMGNIGEAIASRAQAQGRATEVELEILRIADARREEAAGTLRDIAPRVAELSERRRSLTERLARLDLRAPVSGIVLGLQITGAGAVIRPAEAVAYIVPQDRPLVVAARISPLNIDEVQPGQAVRLRLSSLPGRTTPEIQGEIVNISADAITEQNAAGAAVGSYYRAEIRILPDQIAQLTPHHLVPGMPVEAFVETGAHTPMAYLLKPFTDYFRTAFRES